MIQIYYGDGKGKTTAAAGLALRGAGHKIPVLFVQFLKKPDSGEVLALKELPGMELLHGEVFYGFVKNMTQEQFEETRLCYTRIFETIEKKIEDRRGQPFLVILDEVIHACNFGLLEEAALCRLLKSCPKETELVLTGRNPSEQLQRQADYISEIKKIKHPYDKGIPARKGIEL